MAPLCVMSQIMVTQGLEYKILRLVKEYKIFMAVVGFEPTSPRRMLFETSALDHSATKPICNNVAAIRYWVNIDANHFWQLFSKMVPLK